MNCLECAATVPMTSMAQTAVGCCADRPERREDGERTFRLLPGEPLSTSYGPDLYRRIFGTAEPAVSSPQAGEGGSACGPQIT